jgi:hypothetical protein
VVEIGSSSDDDGSDVELMSEGEDIDLMDLADSEEEEEGGGKKKRKSQGKGKEGAKGKSKAGASKKRGLEQAGSSPAGEWSSDTPCLSHPSLSGAHSRFLCFCLLPGPLARPLVWTLAPPLPLMPPHAPPSTCSPLQLLLGPTRRGALPPRQARRPRWRPSRTRRRRREPSAPL